MQKINWRPIVRVANGIIDSRYRWFVFGEVLIVGWIGWTVLLQGEYQHIRESGILEYQNRVEQRGDRQRTLEQLQDLAADLEGLHHERLQQVEAVLPTGLDPVQVMNELQTFATTAGVTILSMDITQSSSAEDTTSESEEAAAISVSAFTHERLRTAIVSMNIATAAGSYAELKTFLDALESFVPILNLRNLTYAPETTSFALQLETYYIDSTTP